MSLFVINTAAIGFFSTLGLLCLALRFGWGASLVRSMAWHHTHKSPIPRLGGTVLLVAFALVEIYIWGFHPDLRASTPHRGLCVAVLIAMFLLGFCDDLWSVGPKTKLMGQVLIAVVICFSGLAIKVGSLPFSTAAFHFDFLGALLTIGWLVGLPNLINVIDGIDGLAGGVSLVLLLLVAAIAHQGGNFELLAGGTAGALLGFLCFNVPPARVYLGDSGAYFLGAQIGLYSLVNSRNGSNPIAFAAPLFLLTLPALDAAVTLTRRALNGLPLFRADRKHLHHRLIAEGGTPREVLLWFYALNLIFFFMGLGALWSGGAWTPFLLGVAILVLLLCATMFSFSRRWFLVHRVVRNSFRVRNHVQHALSLTRWLNVQTRFCSGPDELWPRFVFVTEKLGFVDVLLLGRMKHRRWRRRGSVEPSVQCCYECSNDGYATLVFAAPACPLHGAEAAPPCERTGTCGLRRPRCLSNPQVFHTVSELLAEAWNSSAARWNKSWKNKPPAMKAAIQPAHPRPNSDGENGAPPDRDNK